MEVSPGERRRILLRFGVSGAEIRATQAQLFEDIMKQKITLDTLKTHRRLLDTDIKIVSNYEWCAQFERSYTVYGSDRLREYVDMIKTGFCGCSSCENAHTHGIRVVGLRLIHILVANDKNLPLIAFLHKSGCDMNPLTVSQKLSPLQLAVERNSEAIVKYFVQHFDNIRFVSTFQKALNVTDDVLITKALLSAKHADVNFCGEKGRSLLVRLLERKQYRCDDKIDLIRVFLEAGADLEIADENGNSPLMIAASFGCVETVKLLLKHGSNVNSENKKGDTAMHLAALSLKLFDLDDNRHKFDYLDENEAKIVELLIDKGASPDRLNKEGASPLWNAVWQNCFEVVQTLLAAGVNMDIIICGKDIECEAFCFHGRYIPPNDVTESLPKVALRHADIDILKMLREAGYVIRNKSEILNKEARHYAYSYRYGDTFYQDLIDDWIGMSQSPQRLESLCRARVRKCLGYKIHSKIEQLDIPIPLKKGLLFKDILPSQRRQEDRVDTEVDDYDYYDQRLSEASAYWR